MLRCRLFARLISRHKYSSTQYFVAVVIRHSSSTHNGMLPTLCSVSIETISSFTMYCSGLFCIHFYLYNVLCTTTAMQCILDIRRRVPWTAWCPCTCCTCGGSGASPRRCCSGSASFRGTVHCLYHNTIGREGTVLCRIMQLRFTRTT